MVASWSASNLSSALLRQNEMAFSEFDALLMNVEAVDRNVACELNELFDCVVSDLNDASSSLSITEEEAASLAEATSLASDGTGGVGARGRPFFLWPLSTINDSAAGSGLEIDCLSGTEG